VVLAQMATAQGRAGDLGERVRKEAAAAAQLLGEPAHQALRAELAPQLAKLNQACPARSAAGVGPGSGVCIAEEPDSAGHQLEVFDSLVGADAGQLAEMAAGLRDTVAALVPMVAAEEDLVRSRAEIDRIAMLAEAARTRSAGHEAELRGIHALDVQIDDALAEAMKCASGQAQLDLAHQTWRQRMAAAVTAEQLQESVARAGSAAMLAIDEHQSAVAKYQALVSERIDGMRAELAGLLVAGQACSVCGSTQHPRPAQAAATAVTEQQVRLAAAGVDQAAARRAAAELELASLREQLAAAIAGAAGLDLAAIRAELAHIRVELDRVAAARDVVADLQEMQLRRASRARELAAAIAADTAEAALRDGELSALAAGLTTVEEALDRARGGFPDVACRSAELGRFATALLSLVGVRNDAAAADEHLVELAALAAVQLRRCGFPDIQQAQQALRDPDRQATLAASVADWDTRAAQLSGQLNAPDLAGLDPLDLEAAEKAAESALDELAAASETARVARAEAVAARRRLERFTTCVSAVAGAVAQYRRLESDSAGLAELDRLVRGMDGRKRMTLTTYVLRYWFGQVVAAANLRLATMSTGKYELLHSESGQSSRDRVGLGLTILDRHTGQERGARSLSGGETFYTSLALALGLSDVVAAQAGGVGLDTLFIDEGFGTLDPQTLEEVMAVLDELRGNGRIVGVVSHVAELKERIPERIEVRRERPDGPSFIRVIA
jgi:exonuclease SbcC